MTGALNFSLERVSTDPTNEGGHPESVQRTLFVITGVFVNLRVRATKIGSTYLSNCGIGKVLSRPNATNPSIPTNISERPKMRNRIAWHKLQNTWSTSTCQYYHKAYIKPARNSMYCVYIVHCQKDSGRMDPTTASGLSRGR